jgi:hypothetical protein
LTFRLQYQSHALSGLRNALGDINGDNCSPVLFASILISACVTVSPLLPAGVDDATQSAAEAFLPLPDYLNAVSTIKETTLPWLATTSINDYLDEDFKEKDVHRPLLVAELRRLNEALTPPGKQGMLNDAINSLEVTSQKEAPTSSWLVDAGPDFLDELRRRGSVALAVYMHWGTLLDHMQGIWWAKFSGKRLVEELSTALRSEGPEWTHITTWCRERVGLPSFQEGPVP